MKVKTLIAAAVAAAFAIPLAQAAGDKAASGATKPDGGAEAMFKALDKNKDGYISKEEAKGTPHAKDFATLDKNHDGKLSRQEHAAAPEHQKAASGASSSRDTSQTKSQQSNKTEKKY